MQPAAPGIHHEAHFMLLTPGQSFSITAQALTFIYYLRSFVSPTLIQRLQIRQQDSSGSSSAIQQFYGNKAKTQRWKSQGGSFPGTLYRYAFERFFFDFFNQNITIKTPEFEFLFSKKALSENLSFAFL